MGFILLPTLVLVALLDLHPMIHAAWPAYLAPLAGWLAFGVVDAAFEVWGNGR